MVQSYNNIFILYIYISKINRLFPMLIRNFDTYLSYSRSEKSKILLHFHSLIRNFARVLCEI